MTRAASVAVAWFRRDLRVHDHPAVVHAVERFDRVAPLFVVDDRLLVGLAAAGGRERFGDREGARGPTSHGDRPVGCPSRAWFMGRSLAALSGSLGDVGADLSILRGDPVDVVPRFAAAMGAQAVIVSRDYAPYGRRRDAAVEVACRRLGVEFVARPGVLVHEPEAVRRLDGGSFSIFTPFHRAWGAVEPRPVLGAPPKIPGVRRPGYGRRTIEDVLGGVRPTADPGLIPEPGEPAARRRLEEWVRSSRLARYGADRDRLDLQGTSRLSQDLRWGLVSPVEVLARSGGPGDGEVVADRPAGAARDDRPGVARFTSEIAWRDFYAHLLWHRPQLARESLRPEFEGLWRGDQRVAEAWRRGRTGVPLVDAAMRQLLESGWMHNRARMIVASFLTKQLGIDWRVGAAHFMAHLVDGDVASNSGGWQWAASTGTDAQPWFRAFNPVRQALRFDPEGDYVRRWVPELARRSDLAGGAIHQPPPGAYLPPIVDLAEGRLRALAAYREARARHGPGAGPARDDSP